MDFLLFLWKYFKTQYSRLYFPGKSICVRLGCPSTLIITRRSVILQDQGIGELPLSSGLDLLAIHFGTLSPLSRVHVLHWRVVDDAELGLLVHQIGHGNAVVGELMDVIDGTIDGINDPRGIIRQVTNAIFRPRNFLLSYESIMENNSNREL